MTDTTEYKFGKCDYPRCKRPAEYVCDMCEKYFCEKHCEYEYGSPDNIDFIDNANDECMCKLCLKAEARVRKEMKRLLLNKTKRNHYYTWKDLMNIAMVWDSYSIFYSLLIELFTLNDYGTYCRC